MCRSVGVAERGSGIYIHIYGIHGVFGHCSGRGSTVSISFQYMFDVGIHELLSSSIYLGVYIRLIVVFFL